MVFFRAERFFVPSAFSRLKKFKSDIKLMRSVLATEELDSCTNWFFYSATSYLAGSAL